MPFKYNGTSFRSEWEGRIAKFFDGKNIRWFYEWKRFHFEDCSYLPDFYLPDYDVYIEVKGLMRPEGQKRIDAFLRHHQNLIIVGAKMIRNLEVLVALLTAR